MMLANSLLFGLLAALVSFKLVLLAAAAVLFVHGMTQRMEARAALARARRPSRHHRLDLRA